MHAPVPALLPCDYDALGGGFPVPILESQLPPEFDCVICERIARDAVTACRSPCPPLARPEKHLNILARLD